MSLIRCMQVVPQGVNFINVFMHSFYARRSLKRKKDARADCLFMLLGYAHVKAVRKMLVKLTQDLFFSMKNLQDFDRQIMKLFNRARVIFNYEICNTFLQ